MKTIRATHWALLICITSLTHRLMAQDQDPSSLWSQLSVWEQSKQQQNRVEGVVKTFAHDESNNQYLIKVKTDQGFKTLKICNGGIQSANSQTDFNGGNSHLEALQKAMDKGDKVAVTFGGTWDTCINGIQVETPEKAENREAEAATSDEKKEQADDLEPETNSEPSKAESDSGFADL